jgi:AcrR family transcriptional regulator
MDGVNMVKTAQYHHGNLREELINAALELLDESGIEAVGIRQVARKVGVAHSAPANHFKNKQALFTALATHIFRDLMVAIQSRPMTNADNLRDAIHHFAKTILDVGLKYPNRYKLIWRRDCVDNENTALYQVMEEIYQQLTDTLQTHAKRKHIDVESQAIALWSLIHGYVSLRLDGNLSAGHDEVTGVERQLAIIDVILEGLEVN